MGHIDGWEAAVGPAAVLSLRVRGLVPAEPGVGIATSAPDAVADLVTGIAVGSALGQQRIDLGLAWPARARSLVEIDRLHPRTELRAETQLAQMAAEAWRGGQWTSAAQLSDELVRRAPQLRRAGKAVRATVQRRSDGLPWFEAGVASFGNGALTRAIPAGALFASDPAARALASHLDAVITHATPMAAACARFLGDLTPALAEADGGVADVVRRGVRRTTGELRVHLDAALAGPMEEGAMRRLGTHPSAPNTLAVLTACLTSTPDPAGVLAALASLPGDRDGMAAVAGGLLAAAHGVEWIPDAWLTAPGVQRTAQSAHSSIAAVEGTAAVWFLLDRSGSMSAIAGAVEEGFDGFFAGQRDSDGDVDVTVVQFDSAELHEVLVDRQPIASVPSMRGSFEPRGSTPLLDAVDLLLDRAERSGVHDADQLVVIFTDGHENASMRTSRRSLDQRINDLRLRGWTFLFLGANQDSFDSAERLGMTRASARNFDADASGVRDAYSDLDRATTVWKQRSRHERLTHRDDYWEQVSGAR